MTRGQCIPVAQVAPREGRDIDLVELGIARFAPTPARSAGHSTKFYLDEPVAIAAFLNFCVEKNSFNNWLAQQSNTPIESRTVDEDLIIHRLYAALNAADGCRLDSILDFQGNIPSLASQNVKLVAPFLQDDGRLNTVSTTAGCLPYSCSASTWAQTIAWISGCTSPTVAICAPDRDMGPDLLCIVKPVNALETTPCVLLGFQFNSSAKSTMDALRTLNPRMFWTQNVCTRASMFFCASMLIIPYYSQRSRNPMADDVSIANAFPNFASRLKDLGVTLNDYVAIVALPNVTDWPEDTSRAAGKNAIIAALKSEFVRGNAPVSMALTPGIAYVSHFDGAYERLLQLPDTKTKSATLSESGKRSQDGAHQAAKRAKHQVSSSWG